MVGRSLLFAVWLSCSSVALGQMSGQFYLEKTSFALGEPIILHFHVVNHSSKAETAYFGDPHSLLPGCWGFSPSVSGDKHTEAPTCEKNTEQGGAISILCGKRNTVIQPGEEHTESYVLNIFNRLNAPGTYTVQVARGRPFYADGRPEWPDGVKAEANFTITVNETPVDPELLQPWARQLRSTDSAKRLEAAFVLAAVAPKSLEDTLLTFADDPMGTPIRPASPAQVKHATEHRGAEETCRKHRPQFLGTSEGV